MKPFFIRLFEKAAEKGVSVQVPTDYITVPSLDSSLNAAGNADGEGNANQNMDSVANETTEKSLGSKQLANKDSAL